MPRAMTASSSPWISGALPFPDGSRAAVLLVVARLLVGAGMASPDLRRGASAGVEGAAGPGASQGRLQVAGCGEVGWKGECLDEAA